MLFLIMVDFLLYFCIDPHPLNGEGCLDRHISGFQMAFKGLNVDQVYNYMN